MYGLASVGAAVGNYAVAVTNACARSDERNIFENISDFTARFFGDVLDGVHVHFGDDENVNGCLGIQVLESKDLIIFINFCGRDETCGNFTKNTIFHNDKPFFV